MVTKHGIVPFDRSGCAGRTGRGMGTTHDPTGSAQTIASEQPQRSGVLGVMTQDVQSAGGVGDVGNYGDCEHGRAVSQLPRPRR